MMGDRGDLIRLALDLAGYCDELATPSALRACFADYVDAGVWRDLTMDDVDELDLPDMVRALLRYCRR